MEPNQSKVVGWLRTGLVLLRPLKMDGPIMKNSDGCLFREIKKKEFGCGVKPMAGFGLWQKCGPSFGIMNPPVGSTFSPPVRENPPSFMITDIPNTENNYSPQK